MKNKHTPLPWKVEPIYNNKTGEIQYYIKDINQDTIADLYFTRSIDGETKFFPHPNSEANAAFIVRACNSHYELLEALKDLTDAIKDGMGKSAINLRVSLAEEAIARAEAGQ